jgi:thioredoxin reductase (NADPH)
LPQFRNQDLVVVGGGDSAIEEGSYLTKFASRVYLVHRRDELRASKAMQQRFFRLVEAGKMAPVWNSTVVDVLGARMIEGVRLKNVQTNEESTLPCKGMFVAIGHTPNSQLVRPAVTCDEKGYILLPNPPSTHTNVEGLFAAGDVADHVYRQAVTAAGTGCQAAIDCERWLAGHAG